MRGIIALILILLISGCAQHVLEEPEELIDESEDSTEVINDTMDWVEVEDIEGWEEENETEEPEEEIQEPEESEEPIILSLERFILDTECTGSVTVSGRLADKVKGVVFYIGEKGEELSRVITSYVAESMWFTSEKDDLNRGSYDYRVIVTLEDGTIAVLRNGTFNISACVQIISTNPLDGLTNVSVNSDISISFKSEMDKTSVKDAINVEFVHSKSWSGSTIKLNPSGNLEYETEYIIEIDNTARDSDGHYLDEPYIFSFTTISVPPPVIEDLDIWKLHDLEEDNPHRYKMEVDAYDPDENEPLTYGWKIDCGYFYVNSEGVGDETTTSDDSIEWRFNTTIEDCDDAEVNVTVTNSEDASSSLVKELF